MPDTPSAQPARPREFGPQPIDRILTELGLGNHDLVAASSEQITHKMVSKARRGRWLSMKVRCKIMRALNKLSAADYKVKELFNY
ncbi:MAG: hypothetical protein GX901_10805 [Lentisphaerae bacterium]|nr:hypothetical protein [Lentisphaerota bacterium]